MYSIPLMLAKLWLLLHQQPTPENELALWPENIFRKRCYQQERCAEAPHKVMKNRKKISLHKNNYTTIDTVEHLNRSTTPNFSK